MSCGIFIFGSFTSYVNILNIFTSFVDTNCSINIVLKFLCVEENSGDGAGLKVIKIRKGHSGQRTTSLEKLRNN